MSLAYRLPDAPKVLVGRGQGLGALQALTFALEKPGDLAALVLLAPRWRPGLRDPQTGGGPDEAVQEAGAHRRGAHRRSRC